MKQFIYIFFLIICSYVQGQHITTKTWSSEDISALKIDGQFIYKITIEAVKTKTISIDSRVEGEHNEHLILVSELKNNKLYISTKYQPLFTNKNDKLSAHKVLSIELFIQIPENLNVSIESDNSNIIAKGLYKKITIVLKIGNCTLKNFSGQAKVSTIDGNIVANTTFAHVEAFTKNGIVKQDVLQTGMNRLQLKSINGDITVTQSE